MVARGYMVIHGDMVTHRDMVIHGDVVARGDMVTYWRYGGSLETLWLKRLLGDPRCGINIGSEINARCHFSKVNKLIIQFTGPENLVKLFL